MSVGTLRLVHGIVARTFVHRVVVYQILLIARQTALAVGRAEQSTVHDAVPQTGLHHAAFVVLALVAVEIVGASEDELARTIILVVHLELANHVTVVVEGQRVFLLVDDESHLREDVLLDGLCRSKGLVVDHALQLEVLSQPQLQFLTVGTV